MSDHLPYILGLGLVAGVGIFILYSALTGAVTQALRNTVLPKTERKHEPVLSDLPPLFQRAFGPLFADLGRLLLAGRAGDLEQRLRRSGWRYRSVEDYWGSQMALMVLGVLCGLCLWGLYGMQLYALIGLVLVCGAMGFAIPPINVRDASERRRKALFVEMAWTLDRLAAGLRAGKGLEVTIDRVLAWGAAGGGGLFAAVLRDLSAGLSTNALEFDRFVDRLAAGLPGDNLALDEFLQMVKLHKRGTSITNQLEALAQTMRAELKDRIEELGGAAERRVIILGSGFVLLISVLLSMGLPLLSFFGV